MSKLWTPPKVRAKDRENTLQFNEAIRRSTYEDAICHKWNRELERLDPLLRMVRNHDHFVVGTPLVPGAYHVLRAPQFGGPVNVIPVVDREGKALPEPPGKLLEQLKGIDLQDGRVERMHRLIREAEEERERRRKVDAREARQADALDRWKAVSQASVSMNRDTPWTQNNSPAARRDRAAKKKDTAP